jgi:hypothetical protein
VGPVYFKICLYVQCEYQKPYVSNGVCLDRCFHWTLWCGFSINWLLLSTDAYGWQGVAVFDGGGTGRLLRVKNEISANSGGAVGDCPLQYGRQIWAGGSLLRSDQTQVGEPVIGEHAQWHCLRNNSDIEIILLLLLQNVLRHVCFF